MSDLACVGKEGSSREHGRPPRCADVDAAKLSSMQSATAQKEGLSALTLVSAVRTFWHVRAGTRCRGSPGLPGATPRFWFLFGNRVDGSWGLAVVRNGRIFSFGFGHFLALPAAPFYCLDSLCCSLTRQATQRHRVHRVPVSGAQRSVQRLISKRPSNLSVHQMHLLLVLYLQMPSMSAMVFDRSHSGASNQ